MHCAGLVIFPTLAPSCASDFSVVGLLLSDQTVQFSLFFILLLQKKLWNHKKKKNAENVPNVLVCK